MVLANSCKGWGAAFKVSWFCTRERLRGEEKEGTFQRTNLYDITNSSLHIFLDDILSEEFGSLVLPSIIAFLHVYVKLGSSPGSHAGLLSR